MRRVPLAQPIHHQLAVQHVIQIQIEIWYQANANVKLVSSKTDLLSHVPHVMLRARHAQDQALIV